MRYDEIISEGLVSPSIGPVLFGYDEIMRDVVTFSTPSDVIQRAYYTCLVYADMIQMYYISKARDAGKKIDEIGLADKTSKIIKEFWNCEKSVNWSKGDLVFSFLMDATADTCVFSEKAFGNIKKVRVCFTKARDNYKESDSYGYDDLKELLRSFRLLATTEFVNDDFAFNTTDGVHSIAAQPFFFLLNRGKISPVKDRFTVCHILTAINNGDKNHEIYAEVREFNSAGPNGRKREFCSQIEPDGNLDSIFRTLGISTKWFDSEEYLGDFTFLNNLIDGSRKAIKKFFASKINHISPQKEMQKEVLGLFADTSLHHKLIETLKKPIFFNDNDESSLNNFLFELFINYGVTNALTALLFSPDAAVGNSLFDYYMAAFTENGCLSEEEEKLLKNECAVSISSQVARLEKIIARSSNGFRRRQREIEAEWRTFYILKAAGIKSENLITDIGSVISIDDYFEMIRNPHASLLESFGNLMTFLNAFYGALLQNSSKLNYSKFVRDFLTLKKDILSQKPDVREQLEAFLKILEASVGNKVVNELIGRRHICNPAEFEDYMQSVLTELSAEQERESETSAVTLPSQDRVFISYSHEDSDLVNKVVNALESLDIHVYYDKQEFHGGDNWEHNTATEIQSENCKVMLVFMSKSSVKKDAVLFELRCMKREGKPIIPINLEREPIRNYLENAMFDINDADGASNASNIAKIIPDSKIYIDILASATGSDAFKDDFAEIIKRDVLFAASQSKSEYRPHSSTFSPLELAIANMYAFFKTGKYLIYDNNEALSGVFSSSTKDLSKCVYPLIASVKEKQIRRDNIALLGYELSAGKKYASSDTKYILTSRKLKADDYYCIPKSRFVGDNCQWMVEPLLIRGDDISE